jgi:hypothetical protein
MGLILAMSLFFVVMTMIFVCVAIFLPEWLGITGKKARRVMEEQADTSKKPSSTSPDQTNAQEKNHDA